MKSTPALKGIIFDLDGTLADTLPVCFTAFRRVFLKYLGTNLSDEEIAAYFGVNEEGIFQRAVPTQWEACLEMYLEEYEKIHELCKKPFEGIETVLSYCQQNDIALAIVTGKGSRSAEISLKHLNLNNYFALVETGSARGGIKPMGIKSVLEQWNLAANCVAYIGDSVSDVADAKEVGVIPLAAAWAATANSEQLKAMAPTETFTTVDRLIEWISDLVEK